MPLAKAADQFRSSDVTIWGVVALCCWTAAVALANVSALIPANAFGALHASRLEGGTVNQLREQVAAIRSESDRMRQENNLLLQRYAMTVEAQGEVTRRVGALEISLPRLAERVPEAAAIDNSVTASISDGTAMNFAADGGSVSVTHKPLVAIQSGVATAAAMRAIEPEGEVLPDGSHFGVALGFPVAEGESDVLWQDLTAKVGMLLIGLWPVTADAEAGDGKVIIAGPIPSETQAAELCDRLDRVGIPCEPLPFKGDPLPMLN
jgi:hypothetical protein